MGGAKSVSDGFAPDYIALSHAARRCPPARLQPAALQCCLWFSLSALLRRFLMHPMVRVHFVDVTTQAYLQKTSSRCRVCRAHSASTQASLRMTTPHLHPSAFPCGHGGASLMPHHRKVASEFGPQRSAAEPSRAEPAVPFVAGHRRRSSRVRATSCLWYLITYRAPSPQSAPVCEPPHRLHPSVASCYTVHCCSL
jgi:hypothetical protein